MYKARVVLKAPLVFGNDEQIEASNLVAAYEEASELMKRLPKVTCKRCKGEGTLDCTCTGCDDEHSRSCPDCNGTGDQNQEDLDSENLADLQLFIRKAQVYA